MNAAGAAPVGVLEALGLVETGAVLSLRLWGQDDGPLGQVLDPAALSAFRDICALCTDYGRRPLMRHGVACKCLGADEACFARLVGLAADGEREDAMMLAALIVRADYAPALAGLAESFGLALRRSLAGVLH